MLLSLFFVYTAIYLLNVLQKCYYAFKKIIMHMINSKSLLYLFLFFFHLQLFEPKPQTDPNKNFLIVREHIKRACYHTGILGKPTVLLIHEHLGEDCLQDVACLMNEGENDKEINPKNMGFVLSLSPLHWF